MASKLNPPKAARSRSTAPKGVTSAARVAGERGEATGLSANGNVQFVKPELQRLYELAVATMYGGQSQGNLSADQSIPHIQAAIHQAVASGSIDFVANLIIHARMHMHMRSTPIIMVVALAKALRDQSKSYPMMRTLVKDVIQRADQITDLYACALDTFGDKKHVPTAVKRGVADAFNKFNEYQFAKYNRQGGVTLKDVLRIVHPSAVNDEQGAIFAKIMTNTLDTPITWETQLSANGQLGDDKESAAAVWTRLFSTGALPYMAMLRNLRNIAQAGVDGITIDAIARAICDEQAVLKSKQLPFSFKQAHDSVAEINPVLGNAISQALDVSVGNLPWIGDNVWVIVDFSGSMGSIAPKTAFSNALMLGAALVRASRMSKNFAVTMFGSDALTKEASDVPSDQPVLDICQWLNKHRTGRISGSTDFKAALSERDKLTFQPDTIIVLTDGEMDRFSYTRMSDVNSLEAMKIVINMSGAATTPMSMRDGWYPLAGWSPALFDWIPAMRKSRTVIDALSGPYVPLFQRIVNK